MPGEEPALTKLTTAGGTAAVELTGFGTVSDPADSPAPEAPQAPAAPQTFAELGVTPGICAALAKAGIVTAFPIQSLALPIALTGQDIIGQARTGTGKTLAFGIPIIEQLSRSGTRTPKAPRALVVVPTRELAIQVAEDLRTAGDGSGLNVVTLYGGRAYEPQIEALATVDIVVSTPGRLLDLERQHHLDLSQTAALVLDEADKMLDLGFLPDVERILRLTPPHRQTMLFSATMPGEVVTLARRHLRRATHVRAEQHDEPASVPATQQYVFRAHQMDKIEVLVRVLQADGRGLTIVFCRTKRSADQVAGALSTRGFATAAVHGDLGQSQRERAMRAFRNGKVDVLVATDVAARGLDVEDVTHVVNYECPEDEKAYLHRIGRTGRAGRSGVAVTFVDWHDLHRWKMISDTLGLGQPEPAETYSTSEHLYSALGIPASVTGVLPRAQRERAGLEAEELEDIGETGKSRSQAAHGSRRGGRGTEGGRDSGREPSRRSSGSRVRRRTRGGSPVTGHGDGDGSTAPSAGDGSVTAGAPAGSVTAGSVTAGSVTAGSVTAGSVTAGDGQTAPAQRRRRRRARGSGTHPASTAQPGGDSQ